MALGDEKAQVERTSHDVSKTSNSLKEKDLENTTPSHIPRSDEEYNVTLKTWLVVIVRTMGIYLIGLSWLIKLADPVSFVRH